MPPPRTNLLPVLLLAGLAVVAAGAVATAAERRRRAAPGPPAAGPAFDGVNDGFHAAYDVARERTEDDAPVLVVLTDSLILCRDGQRQETTVTPPVFHVIKSVAHGPVALFSALHRVGDEALPSTTRARLTALRRSLSDAIPQVDATVGEAEGRAPLHAVLSSSLTFVDRVLGAGRGHRPSSMSSRGRWARSCSTARTPPRACSSLP